MGSGHINIHPVPPDPGNAEALPDCKLTVNDKPTSDRVWLVPDFLDWMAAEDDKARALQGDGKDPVAAIQRAEWGHVGEGVLNDVILVAVPDLLEQDHVIAALPEDTRQGSEPLSLMHSQRPLQAPHVDVKDAEFVPAAA